MPFIPLLTGEAAEQIIKDFERSKLKEYSDEERKKTDAAIEKILSQLKNEKE